MNDIEVTQTINVKIKGAEYALTALEATALYNALGCALNMKTTWDNPKNPSQPNQPWQPMPYMPYKFPNDIWYGIPPVSSPYINLCQDNVNVTKTYTSDNWNNTMNQSYNFDKNV